MAKKNEETWTIEVEDKKCVIKKPTREVMGQTLGMLTPFDGSPPNLVQAGSWVISTCWVSGDKEIQDDDDYNVPASMKALTLMKLKMGVIKKN